MAWYDTGTVSVTNGSTTVTGAGTNFVAGVQVGEGFSGPDGRIYEIQAVVSATALTLADAYLGSTQTGQDYKIVPTQSLVATLASQVSTLISDFQGVVDEAGAGKFDDGTAASAGITFTQDQDTGFFRPADNQIGFSTSGTQRLLLTSSALTSTVPLNVDGTITSDGLTVDTNTLHVDAANNRVGIGTDSPNKLLHLKANTPVINLHSDNASSAQISFTNSGGVSEQGFIKYEHAGDFAGSMQFRTSGSEAARLDSSGNLLVGKTSDNATIAGSIFNGNGDTYLTAEGTRGRVLYLNRLTSDGTILDLRKNGATVGSIGTAFTTVNINAVNQGVLQYAGTDKLKWDNHLTPNPDNSVNLGSSSARFKDLYLSGGVVFGAGGPAPITSNTLDDYEEGTFTPEITGWSGSYGRQDGVYTKIGNWVYCYGGVRTNGGTGSFTNDFPGIAGLPFNGGISVSAATGHANIISGSTGIPSAKTSLLPLDGPGSGSSSAFPNWVSVGGDSGNFNKVYLNASSNVEYRFNIAYRTS